jgi:hypothetical protein
MPSPCVACVPLHLWIDQIQGRHRCARHARSIEFERKCTGLLVVGHLDVAGRAAERTVHLASNCRLRVASSIASSRRLPGAGCRSALSELGRGTRPTVRPQRQQDSSVGLFD